GPQNTLTLINNKGYYLIHPDSNAVFGFEFSKAPAVDLPQLELQMKQQRDGSPDGSQMLSEEALYSIQHYAYPRPGYSLYFSLSADKDILLSVFNQWKLNIILLTALFTFLSLAIAFWWVRRQTKEFKSITESIIRFGKNPERVKLNIDRDDEIGDLALSFQEMAHKIDLHLKESHDARVEAIEANTAKQQFLENMSHEIRNPLQSILGMTGMLIQNKPRADQQVFIDTLKFSSETLLALVNDILEYRKLIHGQIELRMQETELEEYVQNILKSHFYDAGQNKVRLKLELDPGLQQQVFLTDGLRLGQILHNLLSNAIRHAPPGSEVRLKVERPRAEELVFTVMDEGLGISPENIENILQQKPVTGLSTNKQNVGLGLPIVIHLLRLFDSALQIESKTGSGSAFQFALKTRFKALAPRDQQPKENQAGFKAYIQSVALLEDDAQNVFFYQQLFDELGIATVAFDTPSKLKPLPNGSYDLFITDLNFPEGPVTRHIEQLKQFLKPEGLLFLVSASDDLDALLGSGRKDFDAILQKPVKSDELKETISYQVFRKHYEWPLMEVLYSNYDHQSDKVLRALEITAGEWQDMSAKLLNAIDKTELHAFDQVYHKLINTMRTFGLQALQSELDQARKLLEEGRADLPNLRERIAFPLHHYLKLFLKEIEKLKAGLIPFPGQPT
ncbi:MAG TPA: hybrid sensor histidine kinase/response regulator, partial [Saprospiraceae bacterium]|nr:hybrid sensor histidine kinase/response regulator [Saprospiraceae bacterium]